MAPWLGHGPGSGRGEQRRRQNGTGGPLSHWHCGYKHCPGAIDGVQLLRTRHCHSHGFQHGSRLPERRQLERIAAPRRPAPGDRLCGDNAATRVRDHRPTHRATQTRLGVARTRDGVPRLTAGSCPRYLATGYRVRHHQAAPAATPPMGWNSWDCYGTTVTEEEVLANAAYMAKNLKSYGWQYVVIDIQWSDPNAKAHGY